MTNISQTMPQTRRRPTLLRTIGGGILRLIAVVLLAVAAVPILLLPFTTAVPAPVWILLALADIALIAAALRFAPTGYNWLLALLAALLVAVLAVVASQRFAMTPPILGADAQPVPGSIASLELVELNGSEQWITLRGESVDNPVLLFLAGGPGGSQLAATRVHLQPLEKHFVVVNWDQPGATKSFHARPINDLTPETYITDGLALTNYLRERFDQERIYVVGESWGSALAVWMAQREPQYFYAIAGIGQMVDFAQTDIDIYYTALEIARERGDSDVVATLVAQGPPPYTDRITLTQANYLLYLSNVMAANPAVGGPGYDTFGDIAGPEYGLYDKVNYFRGVIAVYDALWPQLWGMDLREQAPQLQVPIYFLEGRHDLNAPTYLAEDYYEQLEAPHKELIWFEHSAHSVWIDESARFTEVMVEQVLADTSS